MWRKTGASSRVPTTSFAESYRLTIGAMARRVRGPGLVKAGAHRFLLTRRLELWRSADYRWQEVFEAADVMSEGAVREERDGLVYYGTTSLLLTFTSGGGVVPDELAMAVARLASTDPHARVRAIRIACREAQVRSADPIGKVRAEFVVRPDSRGVRIDIEVEAPIRKADSATAPRRTSRAARRKRTARA